jgi:hypothetical protein
VFSKPIPGCAEDVDAVEFTGGGHQSSGNDMGFRIVVFAAFAIGVDFRGIEVSYWARPSAEPAVSAPTGPLTVTYAIH